MKPISMSRLSGLTAQVIYITQLYLTLRTVTVGSEVDSKADLRAFVVTGKDTKVWKAMSLPVF